ncbi:MAG: NAD(P)-dependent oxidoreductase [Kiritimatiellae bacterium]|nr:NAD(P)-dependent oxidoreductase [Kiritimatiellia bacterium]
MNTYLVSGATGLIGSAVVRALAARGDRVIAAARNAAKASDMFAGLSGVEVVRWDVTAPAEIAGNVDYIVHAASETASKAFVEDPDGVRRVIVEGTRNALTLAAEKHVKGMVFLSTFEVLLDIDPQSPRASYPQAKLEAERLCRESGIPVRIARLVQTFGPGVVRGDKRVFSQFAEAIADGRDIVLHTEGRTARCYCYIDDAVEAILLLLEKGVAGEAYIVANPDTYCTIREMAEMLCRAHPKSKVVVDLGAAAGKGYAPEFQMRLTAEPLEALGWKAKTGLAEAFRRLLESWRG